MNIYNYARTKIEKRYENNNSSDYSDNLILKKQELLYIDLLETESKENPKNLILCPLRAYWYVQNDDEKIDIGFGIAAIVFNLLLFLYSYGATDAPVSNLIITTAELFFGCFAGLFMYFIYRLVRRKLIRKTVFYVFLILYFIFSVPYLPVLFGYETTTVGDFYEATEYTAEYYVKFSKEPETNANRTVCTLPASIYRSYDYQYTTEIYEDYYGQSHGGNEVYALNYHINRLYLSNGNVIDFAGDSEYTVIVPNKETMVLDSIGDFYYITLTTNKFTK